MFTSAGDYLTLIYGWYFRVRHALILSLVDFGCLTRSRLSRVWGSRVRLVSAHGVNTLRVGRGSTC